MSNISYNINKYNLLTRPSMKLTTRQTWHTSPNDSYHLYKFGTTLQNCESNDEVKFKFCIYLLVSFICISTYQ